MIIMTMTEKCTCDSKRETKFNSWFLNVTILHEVINNFTNKEGCNQQLFFTE